MNIDSKILLHLSTQGFLVFLSLFYNFNVIYELNKDCFIIAKGKKKHLRSSSLNIKHYLYVVAFLILYIKLYKANQCV